MSNPIDTVNPLRSERKDGDKKTKASADRPETVVSPSQQGRFLSALEQKASEEKKDDTDKTTPKSIFQVIQPKENKDDTAPESGEQDSEGEEPPLQIPEKPELSQRVSEEQKVRMSHVAPIDKPVVKSVVSEAKKEPVESTSRKKEPSLRAGEGAIQAPVIGITDEFKKVDPHIQGKGEASTALLALVKECAEAIQTMVSKTATTSVVTLKHPPLFEGSVLTVTEFTTARKEFNISFANLSPDARRLIEVTANQEQLRSNLVEKGYTVHMITIEAPPKPIAAARTETQTETGHQKKDQQGLQDQQGMDLA